MKYLITGGAGFIGSHMAKHLIASGKEVKIIDKIPLEKASNLKEISDRIEYCCMDVRDPKLSEELKGTNVVIHFAALADIALGVEKTNLAIEQGTLVTYSVLEAMRKNNIKEIIFSSSGTVYGYPEMIPTSETYGPLLPASLYGASKLASESLISAFCYLFGMKSWIFRFGNVVGKNSVRGIVYDLIKKLEKNTEELEVLGNGEQKKDFVYIDDCINGILLAHEKSNEKVNLFNIGSGTNISVIDIAKMVITETGNSKTLLKFAGGPKGWKGGGWLGDISEVLFDINKLKKLGWIPKFTSNDTIKIAIKETLKNITVEDKSNI